MRNESEIPTTPLDAANWLIKDIHAFAQECDHDPVRTEAYFVRMYRALRTTFRDPEKLALFAITMKENLDAANFDWWPAATTENDDDHSS